LDIDRVNEDWISKVLLTIIMLFVLTALWSVFNVWSYDKCLMRLENSGIVYLDPEAKCDEERRERWRNIRYLLLSI
jgi:hypothetical protein